MMFKSRTCLLSLVVLALLVGCRQQSAISCAGKIIFAAPHGKSHNIYSINPDGSNLQPLTDEATLDGTPVISPQQDKFAFSSYDGNKSSLSVINIDGTSKTTIIDSDDFLSYPLWSLPDETDGFIFLQNERSNLRSLKTLSLDTPEAVETIHVDFPDFFTAHDLTRSPNGDHIAFGSLTAWRGGAHVYTLDLNNQKLNNLTQQVGVGSDPDWSPDGSQLVFVGAQQQKPILEGGMSEIYTMRTRGLGVKVIDIDLPGQKSQPVWSPTGAKIAFINDRSAIYSVNLDGSNLIKLTDIDTGSNLQSLAYEADLDWQAISCNSL